MTRCESCSRPSASDACRGEGARARPVVARDRRLALLNRPRLADVDQALACSAHEVGRSALETTQPRWVDTRIFETAPGSGRHLVLPLLGPCPAISSAGTWYTRSPGPLGHLVSLSSSFPPIPHCRLRPFLPPRALTADRRDQPTRSFHQLSPFIWPRLVLLSLDTLHSRRYSTVNDDWAGPLVRFLPLLDLLARLSDTSTHVRPALDERPFLHSPLLYIRGSLLERQLRRLNADSPLRDTGPTQPWRLSPRTSPRHGVSHGRRISAHPPAQGHTP